MRWRFFVEDHPWDGSRRLFAHVTERTEKGPAMVGIIAAPIVNWLPAGDTTDTPTLSERIEDTQDGVGDVTNFLQAALEAAWESGLRPKGFADHSNELAAVRYHLEDMRALAKVPRR